MASINLNELTAAYGYSIDLTPKFILEFSKESPSNNTIKSMHYHAYRNLRNRFKLDILNQVDTKYSKSSKSSHIEPIPLSFLVVERYCAGGGLDWDNAYGGLKPIFDCLVRESKRNPDGLGLIEDDCPENMPIPPLLVQRAAKRGEGKTVIRIFEIKPF